MCGYSKVISALVILISVMLAGSACADEVYKWVDADGKVHYGEAPPGQKSYSQVHMAPPPSPPKEKSTEDSNVIVVDTSFHSRKEDDEYQKKVEADSKALQLRLQREKEYQDRFSGSSDRAEKSRREQAMMDRCKQNREIYCDKGVGEIEAQDNKRREKANCIREHIADPSFCRVFD